MQRRPPTPEGAAAGGSASQGEPARATVATPATGGAFPVDVRASDYRSRRATRRKRQARPAPYVAAVVALGVIGGLAYAFWPRASQRPAIALSASTRDADAIANVPPTSTHESRIAADREPPPGGQLSTVDDQGMAAPIRRSLSDSSQNYQSLNEHDTESKSSAKPIRAAGTAGSPSQSKSATASPANDLSRKETETPEGAVLSADAPPAQPPPAETQSVPKEQTAIVAADHRAPLPSADERAAAAKKIKEIFSKDFAAATSADRRASLAKTLLKQAADEKDASSQFELFSLAKDLAQRAGNPAIALEAVDQIANRFVVDGRSERSEALIDAAKYVRDAEGAAVVGPQMLDAIERSATDNRIDEAIRVAQAAVGLASRMKSPESSRFLLARVKSLQELQKAHQAAEKAASTLAENPEDPEANLVRGRYLCVIRKEWSGGLPLLLKGGDVSLADCAKEDLANPEQPAAQEKMADNWYEYHKKAKGKMRELSALRAGFWYEKAIPGLTGLEKAQSIKRLDEVVADAGGGRGPEDLLSSRATYTASSLQPDTTASPALLTGMGPLYVGNEFAFHSLDEAGAHITIDLGATAVITRIEIENRRTPDLPLLQRLVGAGIWLSSDPQRRGRLVWTATTAEPAYRFRIAEPSPARYVTIGFPEKISGYLTLFSVKIYGHK
jgi:hypothetical protein